MMSPAPPSYKSTSWTARMIDNDWMVTGGYPTEANPAVWSSPGNQIWELQEVE